MIQSITDLSVLKSISGLNSMRKMKSVPSTCCIPAMHKNVQVVNIETLAPIRNIHDQVSGIPGSTGAAELFPGFQCRNSLHFQASLMLMMFSDNQYHWIPAVFMVHVVNRRERKVH